MTQLSFFGHLDELRSRLIKVVVVFTGLSFFVYFFTENILSYLARPVGSFIFISVTGAFDARISLAFFGGLLLSLPFIFYQIWQFIVVGLKKGEQRTVLLLTIMSICLFLIGGVFAYSALVPFGIKFFLSFASMHMVPMLSIKEYLSFVGMLILLCGIMFEMPIVLLLMAKMKFVTPQVLSHKRREAVVILLVISAFITPQTDIMTQMMVFLPLIGLYEISLIMVRLGCRRTK